MTLKEKIQNNLKTALRGRKELELSVLRMLNAAIINREKEKRYKLSKEKPELTETELEKESQLTDEEVLEVVSSEVKKRKEALLLFEKGERMNLVEKEKKEIEILEKYLPEQLSAEDIKKLAREAIEKVGAKEPKTTTHPPPFKEKNIYGKVMSELMPKIKGKAEGSLVSKIVKELLAP